MVDRSYDRSATAIRAHVFLHPFCCVLPQCITTIDVECAAHFFLVPSLIFIVVDFALVQLHCQPNAKHLPSETCGCASAVVTGVFVVIFNVLDNLLAAVVAHYNSPHFRTLHIHAHTHLHTHSINFQTDFRRLHSI